MHPIMTDSRGKEEVEGALATISEGGKKRGGLCISLSARPPITWLTRGRGRTRHQDQPGFAKCKAGGDNLRR
jgi:hypothetical protein